ncbi:MAG: transcriptional repressor, partial [Prevotellaceae bacterium]|nr:transcriptional repressor [Prevotellaceae bacterium]
MNEEKTYEAAVQTFTEFLTAHKHKKTQERFAILENINSHDGHFSAELLHETMQRHCRVSLATVYNTLDLLCQSHLIVKHQFGTQESQYEKA